MSRRKTEKPAPAGRKPGRAGNDTPQHYHGGAKPATRSGTIAKRTEHNTAGAAPICPPLRPPVGAMPAEIRP